METQHIAYNPLVRVGLFVTLCAASLFLVVSTFGSFRNASNVGGTVAQISVSGTGEAFAVPDVSILTFDVRKEAKDVATAQKMVNDIVGPIVSDLKARGIAEKDIKTLNYSSNPVYDYNSGVRCLATYCPPVSNQVLRGYEVSETIQIKVRKVDTAGDVLTYLGGKGVTNINGPSFTIDDEEAIKAEARAKAIADAQAKADILARDLGVRLVRIISFNDGSAYPMYDRAMMSSEKATNQAGAPAPAVIPTGENKYLSNVTISYEIR